MMYLLNSVGEYFQENTPLLVMLILILILAFAMLGLLVYHSVMEKKNKGATDQTQPADPQEGGEDEQTEQDEHSES